MPEASTDGDRHSNIFFQDPASGTSFEFYWDPVLNSTKTTSMLSSSRDQGIQEQKPTPSIFLVGTGLWYLRYSEWSGGLQQWRQVMEELVETMSNPHYEPLGHNVFISPISAVNTDKLSEERLRTLLPEDINAMNDFLKGATKDTPITVPFSWNKMTETAASATKDGLHYVEKIMTAEADVLLNFVCNNKLPKVAPMSTTCCYDYPSSRWFQTLMLAIFLIWLPLGYIVQTYYPQHSASAYFPSLAILRAFSVLGVSVVYMYYADRTTLFGKGNKMYSTSTFAFLIFLTVVASAVTLRKSEKDQVFLNRDQTDEWKGWMQIVILIYHYVGASSVSAIYNPVRVLVASYLFMTGFGHFIFFYKKADFGFVRVASILTRLNLLTIFLAYTMDTTYISYYFAPLVSFFYLIIYAMMYIGHSYNHNTLFIVSKIVITSILTATMVHIPIVLDTVFAVLHFFFGITWSATEWRFRLKLDVWIVFVGALFAFGFIKAQEFSITMHPQWKLIRQSAIVASVVGLFGYFVFETSMQKFVYNHYHPYVSWVPILSFVILRNSTATLRNTTSSVFTFIGKCSLETFICQFHMWLAGDTKGILIVSPWIEGAGAWTFNLVLSTVLFIAISHVLSIATGELSDWLITGREPKSKGHHSAPFIVPGPTSNLNTSQARETGAGLPIAVKRQSVMLSPIAVSAGAKEHGTVSQQAEGSSRGVQNGEDIGMKLLDEANNGDGNSRTKNDLVSLQIDTATNTNHTNTGRHQSPYLVKSAVPTPSGITFKSLWMQPFWKVTIFFGIIWLLNYGST
ncbi:hypothetical protein BG011_009146 [Mortierella polycephala]|uniref:Cas1p 10 TM acyl transferase domain-containing protein n=1 Tax=Mortierella polycephala TaxID=41804 RepID=A0A9P6QEW0_9FUNG|nr:hypothetical protein BG011_009146 [Mortierella polycephala]